MKYDEPFYLACEILEDLKNSDQWLHEVAGGDQIITMTKEYLSDFLNTTGFVVVSEGTGSDFNEAIRNALSKQQFDLLTSERILVSIAIHKQTDIEKTIDSLDSFFSKLHQEKVCWGLSKNQLSKEMRVLIMGVNPNQKNP